MASRQTTKSDLKNRKPLTIRSMLLLTAVLASAAASFGYLWRASEGDGEEIGHFVIMTAMMPLLILVVSYWTLKFARWFHD
jgi:hypothetical protein